jgi:hypothetical protein
VPASRAGVTTIPSNGAHIAEGAGSGVAAAPDEREPLRAAWRAAAGAHSLARDGLPSNPHNGARDADDAGALVTPTAAPRPPLSLAAAAAAARLSLSASAALPFRLRLAT